MCLQEVKIQDEGLEWNLKRLNFNFTWFASTHVSGKGGTAIGLSPTLNSKVLSAVHMNDRVSVKLDAPYNVSIVSIYAPSLAYSRSRIWDELGVSQNPLMVMGDFNNVEVISDRALNLGHVICGSELTTWTNLISRGDLIDISRDTGFTWSNKQPGTLFRAARLDRIYMSQSFKDKFESVDCVVDKSIFLSDHVPVIVQLRKSASGLKNGWFHADASLFKLPAVQKIIWDIFIAAFIRYESPSLAWAVGVKDSQNALRQLQSRAKDLRQAKRRILVSTLENLERRNTDPSLVAQAKQALHDDELLEAHRAIIFTRQHWAGKIDCPNKAMFGLLKKKKLREIVPQLKDENGCVLETDEENIRYVFSFYEKKFAAPVVSSREKIEARASIARIRKKAIPSHIQNSLDRKQSVQEIRDSIEALALGKTPSLDGLPNEFYKEFADLVSPLLLLVWNESF